MRMERHTNQQLKLRICILVSSEALNYCIYQLILKAFADPWHNQGYYGIRFVELR